MDHPVKVYENKVFFKFLLFPPFSPEGCHGWFAMERLVINSLYRADGVDGPQEMERN